MKISVLFNFVILVGVLILRILSTNALALDIASVNTINANISAIPAASAASQTVSYKHYDKPWLMVEPPKELTDDEYRLGKELENFLAIFVQIDASSSYQPKIQAMVDELTSNTPRPYVKYKVYIIKDEHINAFIIPNASIYVFKGLLEHGLSDDEIAGILAHEIAHNTRFHILRIIDEKGFLEDINNLGIGVKIGGIITGNSVLMALGGIAEYTSQALISEAMIPHEDEADRYGYEYIKKSRYSPAGLMVFMERMAVMYGEDERGYGIYMNHSLSIDRVAMLKKYMEQDGINILAEKRKVLKVPNAEVNEIKPGSATAAYKVVYNKIDIITFTHTDANKVKAEKLAENINQILNNSGEIYQLRIKNAGKTRKIYYKDTLLCTFSDNDLTDTTGGVDIVLQKLKQVIRDDSIVAHRTDI